MKLDPRVPLLGLPMVLGVALSAACGSSHTPTSAGAGGAASSTSSTGGSSESSGTGNDVASSTSNSTSSGGPMEDGGDAGADGGPWTVQPGLTKVATGEYETFFLQDGVIYGYGGGSNLLGLGSYQGLVIPPRAIAAPSNVKFVDVQGGLHQSMAIDDTGHVWTWGEIDNGLQGSGVQAGTGSGATPYMIAVDANGNPFDHVIAIEPTVAFDTALKSDGTLWVWGDMSGGQMGGGVAGDGMAHDSMHPFTRPTQVPLPAGTKITRVAGSSQLVALASDGTVWTWGPVEGGYLGTGFTDATHSYTPQKVIDLPSNIVDVAVGFNSFSYALTSDGDLYGWGYRGAYLGLGDGVNTWQPTPTPKDLKTVLNLPHPVVSIACDYMTTHVILSDGTLWGWGDDVMGEVGDGQEIEFSKEMPTPYAWNYNQYQLMVMKPVQIVPGVSNFVKIFAHPPFDFYDYALTADGKLYSWGRNKTGNLGNGVYPLAANGDPGLSSNMEGQYPNSWDVPLATLVTPFTTPAKGVNSPYCAKNPSALDCHP